MGSHWCSVMCLFWMFVPLSYITKKRVYCKILHIKNICRCIQLCYNFFLKELCSHLLFFIIALMPITVQSVHGMEPSRFCMMYRMAVRSSLHTLRNVFMMLIMTVSSAWWGGGAQVRQNKGKQWNKIAKKYVLGFDKATKGMYILHSIINFL